MWGTLKLAGLEYIQRIGNIGLRDDGVPFKDASPKQAADLHDYASAIPARRNFA
jgi:hypothetical protein